MKTKIDRLLAALKELSQQKKDWSSYDVKMKHEEGKKEFILEITFTKIYTLQHGNDTKITRNTLTKEIDNLPTKEGLENLNKYIRHIEDRVNYQKKVSAKVLGKYRKS